MSRRSNHLDLLAAEYVVGTLTGRARERFARWMRQDIRVAKAVQRWERRLASLPGGAPVKPPPALWKRIEARLPGAKSVSSPWPWLAIAATLAAVALGLREWMPAPPAPSSPPPTSITVSPVFVAHLSVESPGNGHWSVRADPARGKWVVAALDDPTIPDNHDIELWLLAADGRAPVSLGLMPRRGSVVRSLADPALLPGGKLALSLEPAGGSPTGAPTGPVLTAAALEKAV